MNKLVILLTGFGVLALVNFTIYQKEQQLASGRVVYLELVPVDPRSLMQGDYMALRFAVASNVVLSDKARDGYLVITTGNRGIGAFRRLDNGSPLASDELKIFYRVRGNDVRIGSNAFFFQEGDAHFYQGARYAEARAGAGGQILLTGLYDTNLQRLGPPATTP